MLAYYCVVLFYAGPDNKKAAEKRHIILILWDLLLEAGSGIEPLSTALQAAGIQHSQALYAFATPFATE